MKTNTGNGCWRVSKDNQRFHGQTSQLQTVKDSVISLLKPDETDWEAADLLGSVFSNAFTTEDMFTFKPEHDKSHLG